MFGRMMSERLGKLHFWPTFLSLNLVFIGQLLIGYAGMQRRLYDPSVYDFLKPLLPLEPGHLARGLRAGPAQLIFVCNFFWSLARGRPAPSEPLGGGNAGVDRRRPRRRITTSTTSRTCCGDRTSSAGPPAARSKRLAWPRTRWLP